MSFVDALDDRTSRPPPPAVIKTVSPSASASSVPLSAPGQGKTVAPERVVTEDDFEVVRFPTTALAGTKLIIRRIAMRSV
jgi:hypothetical protein